jgi:hypothetical protein
VRRAYTELKAAYDEWIAESDALGGLDVLPIERLVGVQYASTLAMAALLKQGDA